MSNYLYGKSYCFETRIYRLLYEEFSPRQMNGTIRNKVDTIERVSTFYIVCIRNKNRHCLLSFTVRRFVSHVSKGIRVLTYVSGSTHSQHMNDLTNKMLVNVTQQNYG